ncbi:MAG: branched-chain amino acid ABC transporter permease, partial [Chloroflexi bacterium]|nr:branched-chain amino acid ABC transporter permease [Chloroflexota bacterium]
MNWLKSFVKDNWGWFLVIALLASLPVFLAKFELGLLIQVFVLAIFALSYDLLMGYAGILSFGHALFFGMGAYTVAILLKGLKNAEVFGQTVTIEPVPLPIVLLIVIAIGATLGALLQVVSIRVKGVYFAMITLAFAEMAFILSASTELRRITGGDEGLHGVPIPDIINPTAERTTFYFLALGFMILMYVLARRLVNSPTGKVLAAIRENEGRAAAIGYNVFVYRLVILMVSGVFASLCGAMYIMYFRSATPDLLGVSRTIDALLMTIIGGIGTLSGPMLGAAVQRLASHSLADLPLFEKSWPLLLGVGYILLVLFFPYGIVGTWRQRR